MGTLRDAQGATHTLGASYLVGRGPHCTLRLDDRRVSSEHASISWDESGWAVRDLSSRNGTFVGTERVGARSALVRGAVVKFGGIDAPAWAFDDDAPPAPRARSRSSGLLVEGGAVSLLLPDVDAPVAAVSLRDGQWWLHGVDEAAERRAVADGEAVEVGTEQFVLELPGTVPRTVDAGHERIVSASIAFDVSPDGEDITLAVRSASRTLVLKHRAFHELLYVLALARVSDRGGGVGASSEGWLHMDDLERRLFSTRERINLDVFRARRAFEQLGFVDGDHLVERRAHNRQLRLGVANVTGVVVRK